MERTPRVVRQRRGHGGMLLGLCAGIAAHLGIDPLIIRLAFALLVFIPAAGLAVALIYLIFALNTPVDAGGDISGK